MTALQDNPQNSIVKYVDDTIIISRKKQILKSNYKNKHRKGSTLIKLNSVAIETWPRTGNICRVTKTAQNIIGTHLQSNSDVGEVKRPHRILYKLYTFT